MRILTARPAEQESVAPTYAPTHTDLENGIEIPEASMNNIRQSDDDITLNEHSVAHANQILNDLLNNNQFAVAREVAVQTYDSSWFSRENDVSFKLALALALNTAFSADGYRNDVWATIAGQSRI